MIDKINELEKLLAQLIKLSSKVLTLFNIITLLIIEAKTIVGLF